MTVDRVFVRPKGVKIQQLSLIHFTRMGRISKFEHYHRKFE